MPATPPPLPADSPSPAPLETCSGGCCAPVSLFAAPNGDPAGPGAATRAALADVANGRRRGRGKGRPRAAEGAPSSPAAAGGITSLGTVETNGRDLADAAEWGFDLTSGRWLGILPDGRRLWAIEDPRAGGRVAFDPPQATPAELAFRHGGWLDPRRQLDRAMQLAGVGAARLEAFRQCGGGSWVFLNPETREAKLCGSYCHDRFCLPCARARSLVLVENLSSKIQPGHYLHVVLTLRNVAGELRPQLNRLYRCFAKLRKTPQWKKWTDGGAAVLEVKLGKNSGLFHPHLHIVTKSKMSNGRGQPFIPHGELSDLWREITGDSDNVWIARITDARGAAEEIATYVAKPIHRQLCRDLPSLVEMIKALKGRRLCFTFGSWRGWRLMDRIERPDDGQWYRYGSLIFVMAKARAGDRECQNILFQLEHVAAAKHGPAPPLLSGAPPPVFDLSQLPETCSIDAGDAGDGESL